MEKNLLGFRLFLFLFWISYIFFVKCIDDNDNYYYKYLKIKTNSSHDFILPPVTINTQSAIKGIYNFSSFFKNLSEFIDIDNYEIQSQNCSITQPEYILNSLNLFEEENQEIFDFTYDNKNNKIYFIVENGIKSVNFSLKLLDYNSESIPLSSDYIYNGTFESDSAIYYSKIIKEREKASILIVVANDSLKYGVIDNFGKVNNLELLEKSTYFNSKMKVVSIDNFILIPDSFNGLLAYKFKNNILTKLKTFYSEADDNITSDIIDIDIHPKYKNILIVSDKQNGLFYTKMSIENDNITLESRNYIRFNQSGYSYISLSIAHNIPILGAIFSNQLGSYSYDEFVISNLSKVDFRFSKPLNLEPEAIHMSSKYTLFTMKNIVSIHRIGSSKKIKDYPVHSIFDLIILNKSSNFYIIFNSGSSILFKEIKESEPRLTINYDHSIDTKINLIGTSRLCLNFTEKENSTYYDENILCKYILPVNIKIEIVTNESIKQQFNYLLILILIPIIGLGLSIFIIYFRRYRQVKYEYGLLINQSQIRVPQLSSPIDIKVVDRNKSEPVHQAVTGTSHRTAEEKQSNEKAISNIHKIEDNIPARIILEPISVKEEAKKIE